jgi:hypothetical protein
VRGFLSVAFYVPHGAPKLIANKITLIEKQVRNRAFPESDSRGPANENRMSKAFSNREKKRPKTSPDTVASPRSFVPFRPGRTPVAPKNRCEKISFSRKKVLNEAIASGLPHSFEEKKIPPRLFFSAKNA